jgi:endonuclease G, mitochondrial
MVQSISLASVVPKYPVNSRETWARLEKATREYVMRASGGVFVTPGLVFDRDPLTIRNRGVWVPRLLLNLVYGPSAKGVWAHWLDNRDDASVSKPISYEKLVRRTGIEFLQGAEGQCPGQGLFCTEIP